MEGEEEDEEVGARWEKQRGAAAYQPPPPLRAAAAVAAAATTSVRTVAARLSPGNPERPQERRGKKAPAPCQLPPSLPSPKINNCNRKPQLMLQYCEKRRGVRAAPAAGWGLRKQGAWPRRGDADYVLVPGLRRGAEGELPPSAAAAAAAPT